MAKFQITSTLQPGFKSILELTEEEVNNLIESCASTPIGASPVTFSKQLRKLTHISGINSIARTLFALVGILTIENSSDEELALDLADSYNASLDDGLKEDKLEELKTKLISLFSALTTQKLTFKAHSLLTNNDKSYTDAQILSDIRLIFEDDLHTSKRNAVIVHQLKLDFKSDENKKNFFISLDTLDLMKLKSQIERALEKDRLIRQDYKDTITFIEIE